MQQNDLEGTVHVLPRWFAMWWWIKFRGDWKIYTTPECIVTIIKYKDKIYLHNIEELDDVD